MKESTYWITVKYPYKPQRIEVRDIRDRGLAIRLAREMHMTRPTAEIETLRVVTLLQLKRARR